MGGAKLAPATACPSATVSAAILPPPRGRRAMPRCRHRSQPPHFCQVTFQSDKFGATENNLLSVVCVTIHYEVKKASFALTFAGRGCGDPIRGRERIGIPLNVIGAQVAWSVGGLVFYLH